MAESGDRAAALAVRKRRIRWRADHRGMKETDILFGRLADEMLEGLDERGVAEFERLLDAPDLEVVAWATGEAEPPEEYRSALLERLLSFSFDRDSYEKGA